MTLPQDWREFIELLNSNGVEYVVVGGHAVGFPNATDLESTFTEVDKVVQIGLPPNRIDLLTGLSGVDFDEASAGAVAASLGGVPVRIIGKSALLKNKRSTDRTKDIADAEEIDRTIDPNG